MKSFETMTPKEVLSKIYGYKEFRPNQERIIQTVINQEDCLVIHPTGAGKSLCFQIPALCMKGTAIVISPLISLMQNQVMGLKHFGINAEFINSTLTDEEYQDIKRNIKDIKLLYISPERFQQESFRKWLQGIDISFFAIDEAHCVSTWGHDFRPDYMKLSLIKEEFEKPVIALTATADLKTQKDIPLQLGFDTYRLFTGGFDRPNIKILVEEKNHPKDQLMKLIKAMPGQSGIVYCLSRKKVEDTTAFLRSEGLDAVSYHAGLSQSIRKKNQDHFILKEGVVVVATIAFGMGIDKPDVRFVVHFDMPQNIESYYQEIGRAGRDGEPSIALLLYGMQDYTLRNQMIHRNNSPNKMTEIAKLNEMLAFSETLSCKRNYLMRYFGDDAVVCNNCESCLNTEAKTDVTHIAKKVIETIKETNQIYGMVYIALLLKGSEAKNVKDIHKTLAVFNSVEESEAIIKKTIRQLIVGEFIKTDMESGFNNLVILKELDQNIYIKKENAEISLGKSEYETPSDLMTELKQLRTKLASDLNIAPYLVLHDKSIKEMVKKKPKTLVSLKKIHGWGEKRLEKYGKEFLAVINKK